MCLLQRLLLSLCCAGAATQTKAVPEPVFMQERAQNSDLSDKREYNYDGSSVYRNCWFTTSSIVSDI